MHLKQISLHRHFKTSKRNQQIIQKHANRFDKVNYCLLNAAIFNFCETDYLKFAVLVTSASIKIDLPHQVEKCPKGSQCSIRYKESYKCAKLATAWAEFRSFNFPPCSGYCENNSLAYQYMLCYHLPACIPLSKCSSIRLWY